MVLRNIPRKIFKKKACNNNLLSLIRNRSVKRTVTSPYQRNTDVNRKVYNQHRKQKNMQCPVVSAERDRGERGGFFAPEIESLG